MKNKNYLKAGIAVLLSGILLFAVALTGNAAGNGYEQLKALMREEPVRADNMTVHMDLTLTDNGTTVLNTSGDAKVDKKAEKMSGLFRIAGKDGEKELEVYKNGDTALLHLPGSANWYQADCKKDKSNMERFPGRFEGEGRNEDPKLREAFLDTLMGDLKDQVVLEESDGLRTFSLTLDKGNIPVLFQAAFAAGKTPKEGKCPDTAILQKLPAELQALVGDMPKMHNLADLSGERTLDSLRIALTVGQDNKPRAVEVSTGFSGTAEDGSSHTCQMTCKISMNNINNTMVGEASPDPSAITKLELE